MNFRKAILLMGAMILFSCNSSNSDLNKSKTDILASQNKVKGVNNKHEEDLPSLNMGQKWKVNVEMEPYIISAQELLNNYVANSGNDFQKLALALKNKDDSLIESCTMEGASHENLHKWLHPHLVLVQNLGNCVDTLVAKQIIDSLVQSFVLYHQYFQ